MKTSEIIEKVGGYAKRLGCTCVVKGDDVVLRDSKGRLGATIHSDGTVDRPASGGYQVIGVAGIKEIKQRLLS